MHKVLPQKFSFLKKEFFFLNNMRRFLIFWLCRNPFLPLYSFILSSSLENDPISRQRGKQPKGNIPSPFLFGI